MIDIFKWALYLISSFLILLFFNFLIFYFSDSDEKNYSEIINHFFILV